MKESTDDLKSQAQTLLEKNFSNVSAEYTERLWKRIQAFVQENRYITLEDFLKVMALLREDEAYTYKNPEDEVIEESHDKLEEETDFDEVAHDLLPEESEMDHTTDQNEQLQYQLHKGIDVTEEVKTQTDNYLQDDLITLILHDVNQLVDEARSKALDDSLGGISTQDPYYLDKMIAQAPHAVVKGTLKALYQHVGGMYQNLVLGSEIYPDEAGFTGAIKDILADKTMIHGQEPWQVKFGPSMPGQPKK